MKTLHLVLKRQWWNMIASGEKTEEYRDIKPYWIKRLCFTRIDNPCVCCVKENWCRECFEEAGEDWCAFPFDEVCFHLGYTSTTMTFEIREICIGYGNPQWGAPTDREVFIIKLGKRV